MIKDSIHMLQGERKTCHKELKELNDEETGVGDKKKKWKTKNKKKPTNLKRKFPEPGKEW